MMVLKVIMICDDDNADGDFDKATKDIRGVDWNEMNLY